VDTKRFVPKDDGTDAWAANYTAIHLASGPDKQGVTYARAWEIPVEDREQWAAKFTEAYGGPTTDWLHNGVDKPTIYYEEDGL
jgi:hypothetical protein